LWVWINRLKMINVTKAYLPPLEEYNFYLQKIWESSWLTNEGPLAKELEAQLKAYLDVPNFLFTSNGTIALQIPLKAMELTGEIITTPFSYVATTTAILWESATPVFADIEENTFCIDPTKIEALITPKTCAILATHVYGYPCQVEAIQKIAQQYNLKVIYDGAHAFGVKYKNKSIYHYGDVSTLSFHATKLFHTVEGGGMICHDKSLNDKLQLYKTFGHYMDDYFTIGINGKNSEFHAAMGLCNLPRVPEFILQRKLLSELYQKNLAGFKLQFPKLSEDVEYNYAYFPIILETEDCLLKLKNKLAESEINTRRYFYPSLNKLPYLKGEPCPVSESISSRVLCLPLYQELLPEEVNKISEIITHFLSTYR